MDISFGARTVHCAFTRTTKGATMRTRFKKVLAGIGALAALALGGAVISQAGTSTPQKSPKPAIEQTQSGAENSATERDEGTSDDAAEKGEKPDGAEKGEKNEQDSSADDRDNARDESGKDDAGEKGEKADGAEKGKSEVPDDDGPSGHADEPGNPNADHQGEGRE
jgi:hypothetical protein